MNFPQVSNTPARREVRRVLWFTLLANAIVSLGKLVVGLLTGALSMVADGFHSLLDASSNVIGLVGNAIAGQPPDDDHPYGHRRFETVAAMGIGALLMLTAWEIARQAVARLQGQGESPEVTPWSFAVMLVTIVINIVVSRYERSVGRRLNSEVLLADSANTSADVLVSLSVLVSLGLVALGWTWADVVAALIIVILIGRAAWQVLWRTGRVLVDTAPLNPDEVRTLVQGVPGVLAVERVRSRGPADAVQVDVDVSVEAALTTDHAETMTQVIRDRLFAALVGLAEVEVHYAPRFTLTPDYALIARAQADALGLAIHEVVLFHTPDGPMLEMHVEVPPNQMLEDAHHQVSQLEQRVRAAQPSLTQVLTHIEPAYRSAVYLAQTERAGDICDRALRMAHDLYPEVKWHEVYIRPDAHGYALSMHGGVSQDMTVEEAHLLAERTETHLRASIPLLQRVTIHTEPLVSSNGNK